MTTEAPCSAKSCAVANPIPFSVAAPEMTATRSCNNIIFLSNSLFVSNSQQCRITKFLKQRSTPAKSDRYGDERRRFQNVVLGPSRAQDGPSDEVLANDCILPLDRLN